MLKLIFKLECRIKCVFVPYAHRQVIGHPSARATSQDGQYTFHVYVKKGGLNLTHSRPADRPEANTPIYYRFKIVSLQVPFWKLTGALEVNFGPFSLRSSLRVPFWRAYRKSSGQFWTIFVTVFVSGTILESLQEK